MPRVPGVPDLQTGLRSQPVPSVPRLPAELLAGPGDALQRAGAALGRLAIEERDRMDQVRVLEVDGQLDALGTSLLMDPERGYAQKRGQAAIGGAEQVLKQWDEAADQALRSASPRQRQVLQQRVRVLREQVARQAFRHEAGERQSYAAGTAEARRLQAVQKGTTAFGDPAALGEAEQTIRVAAEAEAAARGWSPEETALRAGQSVSALYASAIGSLLAGEPGSAQVAQAEALAKAVQGKLVGPDAARVTEALSQAGRTVESQQAYDTIRGKHGSDFAAMQAEAERTLSGQLRDDVVQRIDAQRSRARAAEAEARARRNESEARARAALIDKAQTAPTTLTDADFAAARRLSILADVQKAARGEQGDDVRAWASIYQKEATGTLTQEDVLNAAGKLPAGEVGRLLRAAAEPADTRSAAGAAVLTPKQQTLAAARQLGLIPNNVTDLTRLPESQMRALQQFARAVEANAALVTRARGGKAPTPGEYDDLVIAPTKRAILGRGFSTDGEGTTRPDAVITRARPAVSLSILSDADRQAARRMVDRIMADAGVRGVTVTNGMVERMAAYLIQNGAPSPDEARAVWESLRGPQ